MSFAAVLAVGLVGLLVVGSLDRRSLAFTLGVVPTTPVAELRGDRELCQRPVDAPASFTEVRLNTAGPVGAAPELRVEVRDAATGRRLARGVTDTGGGLVDGVLTPQEVRAKIPTVAGERQIEVCATTAYGGRAAVYGNTALAVRGSRAYLDGRPLAFDVGLSFGREDRRSLLSLAPEVVDRAALFHGSLSAPWLLWLVAVLLVTALPALLLVAVRAAVGDEARSGRLCRVRREGEAQPSASARE